MPLSRKDIHKTLYDLHACGGDTDDIQALLINTDDLTELLASIPEAEGMGCDLVKLFGVRIIESKWAEKGTILKIFKTDNQLYPSAIPYSGVVQGPNFSTDNYTWLNDYTDKSENKVDTPEKQDRHSQTRKIELD